MAAAPPEDPVPTGDRPQSRETSRTPEKEPGEVGEEERSPVSGNGLEPRDGRGDEDRDEEGAAAPPLPEEDTPPLPNEPVPGQVVDDGWDALWDDSSQAYYFYNRLSGVSQWENPRIPQAQSGQPVGNEGGGEGGTEEAPRPRAAGGYDPAIHGDYDPTAWYAQQQQDNTAAADPPTDPNLIYTATGTFNRFTGKWQPVGLTPENFNDENKSRRQMNAYFDVDAAANSHDGKSLKAERSGKKLTKKELKAFKEKRRERKEEKRRAWLRD